MTRTDVPKRPAPRICTGLIACAVSALPLAAHAQATGGTITGTMNSDDAIWTVAAPGDTLPATNWREVDETQHIRIVGYPEPEATEIEGALIIEFTLVGAPQEYVARDVEVSMDPEGERPLYFATNAMVDLNLTAVQQGGRNLAIAGDLVATLTPGGADELVIAPEEQILIDGNFQATVVAASVDLN